MITPFMIWIAGAGRWCSKRGGEEEPPPTGRKKGRELNHDRGGEKREGNGIWGKEEEGKQGKQRRRKAQEKVLGRIQGEKKDIVNKI